MWPVYHNAVTIAARYTQIFLCSSALVVMGTHSVAAKSSDNAIHFTKGAISHTVSGQLGPDEQEHWYHFQAEQQQYTVINILPLAGTPETANVGVLHMPNGMKDGTKGGIIYQGCLPATGEYRLRIARNLMATQGGIAGYNVEVMILPKHASKSLC